MPTIDNLRTLVTQTPFPLQRIEEFIRAQPAAAETELLHAMHLQANNAIARKDNSECIGWARALVTFGKIYTDEYARALGFYFAAYVKFSDKNYVDCIENLKKSDAALVQGRRGKPQIQLQGYVHHLFALSYYGVHNTPLSLSHATEAEHLFQASEDQQGLAEVAKFLRSQEMQNHPSVTEHTATNTRLVNAIAEEEATLAQITAALEAARAEFTEQRNLVTAQHVALAELSTQHSELVAACRSLQLHLNKLQTDHTAAMHGYEVQITALSAELSEKEQAHRAVLSQMESEASAARHNLQQALTSTEAQRALLDAEIAAAARMLQHAKQTPRAALWIQLVRAEMATGTIDSHTYAMLDRLSRYQPEHTVGLVIELDARTHAAKPTPYNLNELSGDTRLFAARVNARSLLVQDPFAALTLLADEWERYLGISR